MKLSIPFDNSYARLPAPFHTRQAAAPVRAPRLIRFNAALACELGITGGDDATLARVFSGNEPPEGAAPLAQVYAGHQFGGFSPRLGDGRALLLGEVVDRAGHRRDIQLKGSGPTPYSRMGDGRAWLGPVLREYVVSEAMHALGIPTTRALAAVATGEQVWREAGALPGAVLTRVAASHIRVGTFQYFAARRDPASLRALYDYTVARHYSHVEDPAHLLSEVIGRQARLVAGWLSVGFIHGVMNTDNTAVSGETIDYGPCAFLDTYHPQTVYSSIDAHGRYAYDNQAHVIVWNMAQFATALCRSCPSRRRRWKSSPPLSTPCPTGSRPNGCAPFAPRSALSHRGRGMARSWAICWRVWPRGGRISPTPSARSSRAARATSSSIRWPLTHGRQAGARG